MKWVRLAVRPALLIAVLVGVGLVLRQLGLNGAIRSAGEQGPAVFVVVVTLLCAVGVPRQVVAYAGGLAFGFWPGVGLAMLAEMGGCAADFWWARLLGRAWVARWIGKGATAEGRIARLDRFLAANAFAATLTLRLLPVGSNMLLNLVAGVSGVRAAPFMAASAIGYLPQTVVFALLGGGVRVSQETQMGLAVGLMAVSVGVGVWLLRRRGQPVV